MKDNQLVYQPFIVGECIGDEVFRYVYIGGVYSDYNQAMRDLYAKVKRNPTIRGVNPHETEMYFVRTYYLDGEDQLGEEFWYTYEQLEELLESKYQITEAEDLFSSRITGMDILREMDMAHRIVMGEQTDWSMTISRREHEAMHIRPREHHSEESRANQHPMVEQQEQGD